MKKKNLLIAVFVVATAMFSGCAKDGATGPQGPAGTNGSANVNTALFNVTPGQWNNPSSGYYNFGIADADITNSDNDVVMVYMLSGQTGGSDTWVSLPISNWFVSGDDMYFTYFGSSSAAGEIALYYNSSSAQSSTLTFKAVVIPPAARMANTNVNLKNYEEVKAAFNLQD